MYFFSFIYNMLKCQKEEKGFCKTQKYELQLLPVACCFHKNELELFREAWPRRPPPSPDASGLPAFPPLSAIFYFFSIFCIQHISVSLPATYTHSRQHILFGFFLLPERYAFIIFSFEVFSFFRKSPRFLPASAGRILPASFLSIHKSEPRVPACRPYASRTFFFQSILSLSPVITLSSGVSRPYLTRSILTNSQARTSHAGLPASITQSPTIPTDALRHLPMPPGYLLSPPLCRSLPLLQYPIFSFFFLLLFFFFSFFFFLSSSPFLFIFSLHFLFSRLFLSSFLFSFSYPLFLFSFFYFYHHACFSCAPSQRLKNRT